jgi:mRNA interferase RelE/StbE
MSDEAYDVVVTAPARRALTDRLPEPIAAAVVEFMTTTLILQPTRVGKPVRGALAGIWSARRGTYRILCRGTYRILYRVVEPAREVVVLRIEHRARAYRRP